MVNETHPGLGCGVVYETEFSTFAASLPPLLDAAGLPAALREQGKKILLKPNLVELFQPPITTPVALVAALVDYLQSRVPELPIIIGEGCGSLEYDTWHVFKELGYLEQGKRDGVELLDLNELPLVHLQNPHCKRWPEFYLPELLFDCFLLSVPVLKAHSLAGVTLTMKNMMGTAPPKHYKQGGHWKKAAFHTGMQEAVFDLNRYRTPDFTVLDASVGMAQAHLWGPTCEPPVKKVAAGFDPVAIDAYGCTLLKREWRKVGHIAMAHGEIGLAAPLQIETVVSGQ